MNKKTIGPVAAIALLLVVSLMSVITYKSWFTSFKSSILSNTEAKSQDSTDILEINEFIGNSLYIKNGKYSL